MDMEKIFANLVSAALHAKTMDEAMQKLGYDKNPYFTIYGEIADAIYGLLREHTDTFNESITATALSSPNLSGGDIARILFHAYNR